MREGQWVLYYPNDLDADTFHQVKIVEWVTSNSVLVQRATGGREEVAAYKLASAFVTP